MYSGSTPNRDFGEPQKVQPATQLVLPYFLRAAAEVRAGVGAAFDQGEEEPPLCEIEDRIIVVIKRMMIEDDWVAIATVLEDINWMRLFVRRCLIAATQNAIEKARIERYGDAEQN